MNINKIAAALIAATALVSLGGSPAQADVSSDRVRVYFVPCTSDKPVAHKQEVKRCVHDARHMSNGEGRSFKYGLGGKITMLNHKRAHRLLMTCGCPSAWR